MHQQFTFAILTSYNNNNNNKFVKRNVPVVSCPVIIAFSSLYNGLYLFSPNLTFRVNTKYKHKLKKKHK